MQKKTYTPDYLSHEKKYNKGQEEFVIIKDHHEPIISREIFEEANRILDSRALSQEGKAKHSNRYPFSGKIKCGQCGKSYVARYKKRKDGTVYKAWNCFESHKNGKAHIDKAGNAVGCNNRSINNEDALNIMKMIFKYMNINQEQVVENLMQSITDIILLDIPQADIDALDEKIENIKKRRTGLIELFTAGDIDKEEFIQLRKKYDCEIEKLNSMKQSIDEQQIMVEKHHELTQNIKKNIIEIINSMEVNEEFYSQILESMVIHDRQNIDVYLKMIPQKWSFTIEKAKKLTKTKKNGISNTSVPMSVSRPLSSG